MPILLTLKHMGLNTIRLEGKIDREEFFEKTDRLGILVMPGWICCDMWEHWDDWTAETKKIAAASLVDQITRLRSHPSVFVWLYGSDNPPPARHRKHVSRHPEGFTVAQSFCLFRFGNSHESYRDRPA